MTIRFMPITLGFLAALWVSACDLWPRQLESLADSITRQGSGDTTAWLAGGDVVVITVERSPHVRKPQPELEALATDFAQQAMESVTTPLESIAITFFEGAATEDPEHKREFIFLVMENRPVLQPNFDVDATGPLTPDELEAAVDRLDQSYDRRDQSFSVEQRECVLGEMVQNAQRAGNPETLDPASVEYLSVETWTPLDAFSKRIILTQALMTEALFDCVSNPRAEPGSG